MNNGEKAVRYMRKMATNCHWKVCREIHYTKTDGSEVILEPGVWYTGIPYTQGKKKRLFHLLRFKLNLFGGFLFIRKSLVGCDCSSAASFSWKRMNPKFPVLSTKKMFKDLCGSQKFILHLGKYDLDKQAMSTKEILLQNGIDVMSSVYESLSIGDGLLQYDKNEKRGHIMLVTSPAEGRVLKIIDQKGFGDGGSERDDTSWRVDYPYTFEQLMDEGYLPVFIRN